MRVGRLPTGLVVPALLVALVALLATLQYRWLGKVSEAEREQLRRSLEQRAREFADDFDGEISRLYLALEMPREAVDAGDWTAFAAGFERWHTTSRFPQLVRALYLVDTSAGRKTLRRFDAVHRSFEPPTDAWPQHLQQMRDQLIGTLPLPQPPPRSNARFFAMAVTPIAPDVPALLVPIASHAPLEAGRPGFSLQWSGSYVLADLDAEYLHRSVVPALVARHFPERGSDDYRVAVLSSGSTPIFVRGFAPGAPVDPARADLVTPFFTVRLDVVRELLPGGGQNVLLRSASRPPAGSDALYSQVGERMAVVVEHHEAKGKTGPPTGQIRVLRAGWRLVLGHASGSLDAAVSQARRRNLWLGFGILGVLAAGVALVVVNARRAGRLAAQQMDFVATVSHELRTPLAVIRSAAQNLSAGVVAEPDRARRYGDLIESEGQRLTEMVEQVLEFARVQGQQGLRAARPIDAAALVEDVARSCRPLCDQAGVTLEVNAASGEAVPVTVLGDEAALRRALHNLVSNALKHAAGGRWIGITVDAASLRRRREVRIAVADRGPGIDAADVGRVFEPFYRGRQAIDGQVHGNGLGLSLAERVVEAHGGSITVKSTPGEGSVFTLHLPLTTAIVETSSARTPAGTVTPS